MPLDAINEVRVRARGLKDKPMRLFTIPFNTKNTLEFRAFIGRLQEANSSPIFLWTSRSEVCGLLELPSLSAFNFGFEFALEPNGIVVLMTTDTRERLTLDYGKDKKGPGS